MKKLLLSVFILASLPVVSFASVDSSQSQAAENCESTHLANLREIVDKRPVVDGTDTTGQGSRSTLNRTTGTEEPPRS